MTLEPLIHFPFDSDPDRAANAQQRHRQWKAITRRQMLQTGPHASQPFHHGVSIAKTCFIAPLVRLCFGGLPGLQVRFDLLARRKFGAIRQMNLELPHRRRSFSLLHVGRRWLIGPVPQGRSGNYWPFVSEAG